jgi:hypothetical protein
MTPTKWIVAAVIAMVAIAGIFLVLPKDEEPTTTSNTSETSESTEPETTPPTEEQGDGTYTAAEVAEHDTKSDCWTIINGSVYNLTPFIAQHPGGDEILAACGIDGSTLFNSRETADGEEVGSGTPHSSSAQSQLADLKVGTLAN